jgi:glucosyl-dolichyl phosphate glucuronosyltransferase
MKITIIIVTRNRADELIKTIESIQNIEVPYGFQVELLVIDNDSSDDTEQVVRSCKPRSFQVRYLVEKKPGLSQGRNRGIAESNGEIVMFTDDDVRVPREWISGMCEPILHGHAEIVAGGVRIASHLLRPWMSQMHRSWLASTEWLKRESPQSAVGANMAFTRSVLHWVPGFDTELGAGALGSGEESLFFSQLLVSGNRIYDQLDLCVEHHFQPCRLKRESWINAARARGESLAYIGHHWEHWECRFGTLRLFGAEAKLLAWRARNWNILEDEGCSEEEIDLVFKIATIQRHLKERYRKRHYTRHGLVKLE